MAGAALLAEPQLRQFREAGYVVVPRLVGEELLRSYREQFWSLPEIDADPEQFLLPRHPAQTKAWNKS